MPLSPGRASHTWDFDGLLPPRGSAPHQAQERHQPRRSRRAGLGVARSVSAFALLSIGTGEGAVLTVALAYGLCSSLDSVFDNCAHAPGPMIISGGGSPAPVGTSHRLPGGEG